MKVIAYTRFSTDRVGEESPSDAILVRTKVIEEYAAAKGWDIEKKYSDRKHDTSADTAFNEMKMDGIHRKFDLVIADSLFHFGRGYSYAEELLLRTFYPAGIGFAVVEDDFCSLEHSEDEVKQYFRDKHWLNFTEKSHDATIVQLSQKELQRQTMRYGYKFSDDHMNLVLDEEAAVIIKEIFERYINHESLWGIANDLERRGVTAPPDRKAQMLSLSDGDMGIDNKDESNSIENQRLYIRTYLEDHPDIPQDTEEYIDDGYSGTSVLTY